MHGAWNRYKISSKKGLVFEIIIGDWLEPGDYSFGKVELLEELNNEQRDDYIEIEENIMRLWSERSFKE